MNTATQSPETEDVQVESAQVESAQVESAQVESAPEQERPFNHIEIKERPKTFDRLNVPSTAETASAHVKKWGRKAMSKLSGGSRKALDTVSKSARALQHRSPGADAETAAKFFERAAAETVGVVSGTVKTAVSTTLGGAYGLLKGVPAGMSSAKLSHLQQRGQYKEVGNWIQFKRLEVEGIPAAKLVFEIGGDVYAAKLTRSTKGTVTREGVEMPALFITLDKESGPVSGGIVALDDEDKTLLMWAETPAEDQ